MVLEILVSAFFGLCTPDQALTRLKLIARPFVSSQRDTSVPQQVADLTRSGSIRSSLSVPSVEFPPTKRSLFERFGARIMGLGLASRLVTPKSLSAWR